MEQDLIKHVCFVSDGHRSYALINKLSTDNLYDVAYSTGALNLENVIKITFDKLHIKYLTTNIISRENCINRKAAGTTMAKMTIFLFKERLFDYFIKNEIRVKFIGDLDLFYSVSESPEKLKEVINEIESATSSFNKYFLTMLTAYDPVYEYAKLISNNKNENLNDFENYKKKLKNKYFGFEIPSVDFVIRTWWPRYSIIPILVGEHADVYLFPGPQEVFNEEAYMKIIVDYKNRIKSKNKEEKFTVAEGSNLSKLKNKISSVEPLIIGSMIDGFWVPIK